MSTLKRLLAMSLALVMAMSVMSFATFSDAEDIDENCLDAINLLNALGIIAGFPDGTFAPNGEVTRAQAAKMI